MPYYGDFAFRVISYIVGLFVVPVVTLFLVALPISALGFGMLSFIMWVISSIALYIVHVIMTKINLPN